MSSCNPSTFNASDFNQSDFCLFIKTVDSCQFQSGFLNYYYFEYCMFDNRIIPTILMVGWFLLMLVAIATSADSFLAPCLVVVGKSLKMSQNIAGVTLLAFGNGAVDVFSSLSAVTSGSLPNVGLSLGAIIGAGIFVNAITAGIIIIAVPFKLMHRPIMKDLVFYFIALIWVVIILIRRVIDMWLAIMLLVTYLIYILVTVGSRLMYVKRKRSLEKKKAAENPEITVTSLNDELPIEHLKPNFKISTASTTGFDNKSFENDNHNSVGHLVKFSFRDGERKNSLKSDLEIGHINPVFENKGSGKYLRTPSSSKYGSTSEHLKPNFKISIPSITELDTINSDDNINSAGYLIKSKLHDDRKNSSKSDVHVGYSNPANPSDGIIDNSNVNRSASLKYRKDTHTSFSFVNSFLGVPRMPKVKDTRSRKFSSKSNLSHSTNKSNISGKKYYTGKSNFKKSTSHRGFGSFANFIIKNEQQKELLKHNFHTQPSQISRSASLIINEFTPKIRIRFSSMDERTLPKDMLEEINRMKSSEGRLSLTEEIQTTVEDQEETVESVKFPGKFMHFLLSILPVDIEEWKEQSTFKKIMSVLQSPFMFILTITIPVVDDGALLNGWCKILNCIHCLICPVILVILVNVFGITFGNSTFNLAYMMIIVGVITSIVVAATSQFDKPPKYHLVFAFAGLILSVVWVYEIANEIVNMLTVFGIILNISDTILGLSILAWANSITDLVSNVTLAKRNYPRIGYSACIGGPLFNLLLGIGLPFTIKAAQGPVHVVLKSEMIVLVFAALLITLMNIICLPVMKFKPRRFYGIILIVIYVLFLIFVIIFATNVINVTP